MSAATSTLLHAALKWNTQAAYTRKSCIDRSGICGDCEVGVVVVLSAESV